MADWPGTSATLVEELMSKARERLVTVADSASLIEAAKLLQAGTDLVIVCDAAGRLVGIITKTDIVAQISHCHGAICTTATSLVMTRDVLLCESKDLLRDVWQRMKTRDLKHVPVVDPESRPLGFSTPATFCKFFSVIRNTKMPCCEIM